MLLILDFSLFRNRWHISPTDKLLSCSPLSIFPIKLKYFFPPSRIASLFLSTPLQFPPRENRWRFPVMESRICRYHCWLEVPPLMKTNASSRGNPKISVFSRMVTLTTAEGVSVSGWWPLTDDLPRPLRAVVPSSSGHILTHHLHPNPDPPTQLPQGVWPDISKGLNQRRLFHIIANRLRWKDSEHRPESTYRTLTPHTPPLTAVISAERGVSG